MERVKDVQTVVHELANIYVPFFDVERGGKIGSTNLAFSAVYNRRDERYMFTKKIKVWGVDNQQIVFVAAPELQVSEEYVDQLMTDMIHSIKEYVPQHGEHMSTVFTGIIITNRSVTSEVIRTIEKVRRLKFLKFGTQGWVEMYIAILDHSTKEIYMHKKGKIFIEPLYHYLKEEEKA
ncbi:hypothetical protein [Bacillus sp. FJAT-52991]|uniref:DUF8052 domain-containing protein n=1 Tax=Bacillus kandeliae TaxID=3129297 RepID=A0ABZ2NBB9_9BACI